MEQCRDRPTRLALEPRQRSKSPAVQRGSGDDGAALVEFALLLPFLALLVFGTVDLGRAFQLKNAAINMAREGAAYGQFNPARVANCATGDDIVGRAQAENPGLAVTVAVKRRAQATGVVTALPQTCTTASAVAGDSIIVTVTTEMTVLTPLVSITTGSVADVSGSSEMVVQG